MIIAGDIGGTKTNIALFESDGRSIGTITTLESFPSSEYISLDAILNDICRAPAYEWWYFDAVSDDGRDALVIIFLSNFIFSPALQSRRRREPAGWSTGTAAARPLPRCCRLFLQRWPPAFSRSQ